MASEKAITISCPNIDACRSFERASILPAFSQYRRTDVAVYRYSAALLTVYSIVFPYLCRTIQIKDKLKRNLNQVVPDFEIRNPIGVVLGDFSENFIREPLKLQFLEVTLKIRSFF